MKSLAQALTLAATFSIAATAAGASDLASTNAFACGAVGAASHSAAARTGARFVKNRNIQHASGSNPQFSSMVKLRMVYDHGDFTETEHCGGTVIDSRWVVTAAHCVQGPEGDPTKWDRIEITAGDQNLKGKTTITRRATDAICHSGFDYSHLSNDIALIRLDEPLPAEVVPATMDSYRRPSLTPGGLGQAAGWPVTGSKAGQQVLQTLALAVKKVEWPGFITVTSPSGGNEGVCRGESGGPLVGMVNGQRQLAGVLSGIETGTQNSAGEPCMKAGYEMYFTPIAAYRTWIDTVRAICDRTPGACKGQGSGDFFISANDQTQPKAHASIRTY